MGLSTSPRCHMANLGTTIRSQGYSLQLNINGTTLTTPYGEVSALVAIDALNETALELGIDPREFVTIDIMRCEISDSLRLNDVVSAEGMILRITKRNDNPANPVVTFNAQKVTTQDR